MDHTAHRASVPQRHVESVEHQLGAQALGHGPAHHAAAAHVEDHGHVEEARPGGHVGDVGDPELIDRRGHEVAPHEIRGRSHAASPSGGHREAAAVDAGEAELAHQTSTPLGRAAHPTSVELGMDPGHAVCMPAVLMHRGDELLEHLVLERMRRRRALSPRPEAAGGNAQHAAEGGDPMLHLLSLHELEPRYRLEPVS